MQPQVAPARLIFRHIGYGWSLLLVEILVAFWLTPFIVRSLGTAGYGVWSLVVGMVGYFGLIDLGIRGSVGRYVNQYLARNEPWKLAQTIGTAALFLSGMALLALILAIAIGFQIRNIFPKIPEPLAGELSAAFPIMIVGLWLSFLNGISGSVLGAKELTYLTSIIRIASTLTRTVLILVALNGNFGLMGLALAVVISACGELLAQIAFIRGSYPQLRLRTLAWNSDRFFELARLGVASFATRAPSVVSTDAAALVGMWILGPEILGSYAIAQLLLANARRVTEQISASHFASVNRTAAVGDFEGLLRRYSRNFQFSLVPGCLIYCGLAFFGATFVSLWIGISPDFLKFVIAILALSALVELLSSTSHATLIALDRTSYVVIASVVEAVAVILLMASLANTQLGPIGLAVGIAVPRIAMSVLAYPIILSRHLNGDFWKLFMGMIKTLFLAAITCSAALYGISLQLTNPTWSSFSISVAASIGIYTLGGCVAFLYLRRRRVSDSAVRK